MIPKREILLRSQEWSLRPEVVEKDYVLGWMLAAILRDVAETTETLRGVQCPRAGVGLEPRRNKAGDRTYEGSIEYRGPLAVPTGPKIRFDITKHERTFPPFERREVLHSYPDELPTSALVQTYSLEELVAEKSRTLIERSSPRDLYDVVHLGQHRRDELDADRTRQLFHEKCTAEGIPDPDPRRDRRARRAVGRSAGRLEGDARAPAPCAPRSEHVRRDASPRATGCSSSSTTRTSTASSRRTRLRRSTTGKLLLFVAEDGQIRSLDVDGITNVSITARSFVPRWTIELVPGAIGWVPPTGPRPPFGGTPRTRSRGGRR